MMDQGEAENMDIWPPASIQDSFSDGLPPRPYSEAPSEQHTQTQTQTQTPSQTQSQRNTSRSSIRNIPNWSSQDCDDLLDALSTYTPFASRIPQEIESRWATTTDALNEVLASRNRPARSEQGCRQQWRRMKTAHTRAENVSRRASGVLVDPDDRQRKVAHLVALEKDWKANAGQVGRNAQRLRALDTEVARSEGHTASYNAMHTRLERNTASQDEEARQPHNQTDPSLTGTSPGRHSQRSMADQLMFEQLQNTTELTIEEVLTVTGLGPVTFWRVAPS
jgi:hypothetical protein